MNVSLGATLDRFVESLVRSGRYQSHSEVLREGLRLMQEREELRKIRLAQLKADLQVGLDEVNRGEVAPLDFDEVRREGMRVLQNRRKGK